MIEISEIYEGKYCVVTYDGTTFVEASDEKDAYRKYIEMKNEEKN